MNKASYDFYDYCTAVQSATAHINQSSIDRAYELLINNMQNVVIFGNGGSASIADHFCCDFVKGIRADTKLGSRCTSLASNGPLVTALANDFGYNYVFAEQISYHKPSLAIAVSSSGNSKNVLNALDVASEYGIPTIALVGFDGGKVLASKAAKAIIHVQAENYGIIEDCHMMILHSLVQKIRRDNAVNPSTLKL